MTAIKNEILKAEKHPIKVSNKDELYKKLQEGLDDIENGRAQPFDEAMREIRKELAQYGV